MTAALKLIPDGRDTGETKLISAAVEGLHCACVFAQYPSTRKVTIFGSARTPAEHPDYSAAVEFSRLMAQRKWMAITGAGDGIMKAGHEGGRAASFGVAIRLLRPAANTVIAGDEKLINFRYFFTKLMFLSQCDAVMVYPVASARWTGSTRCSRSCRRARTDDPDRAARGRACYWDEWHEFVTEAARARMINDEDRACTASAGRPRRASKIERFYRVYHSSRYVRDGGHPHELRDQ